LGADRKGHRTRATNNPYKARKSHVDSRGRPQVELPQPWSEGAREPEATGQGLKPRTKSPMCPRTTPSPGRGTPPRERMRYAVKKESQATVQHWGRGRSNSPAQGALPGTPTPQSPKWMCG